VGEPPVGVASLIVASWDVSAAATVCPGTLTVDIAWDWAARSPTRIDLVARMYPQTRLDDPPTDLSVPAGLPATLAGGAGVPLNIDFDTAGVATVVVGGPLSASIQYFHEHATSLTSGVQGVITGPRRYRLTISGFGLDYSWGNAIGMALWARATEARGRVGAWSATSLIASAADPRPPVLAIKHENVLLTSMPDAAGEYHALLTWPPAASAVGYFAYTCSETNFLDACGLGDPLFSQTLSDRLATPISDPNGLDASANALLKLYEAVILEA